MFFTQANKPGFGTELNSEESQVWRAGRHGECKLVDAPCSLDSASVDAGNTPTTTIRGGAILMRQSTNLYIPYKQSAKEGKIEGVLPYHLSTLVNNVATAKFFSMLISGFLRAEEIWNLDYYAAGVLRNLGFTFNDPSYNVPYGAIVNELLMTSSPITLTAADNGTRVLVTMAGAATINIPDPVASNVGLHYEFYAAGAGGLTVDTPTNAMIITNVNGAAVNTLAATVGKGFGLTVLRNEAHPDATPLWYITNAIGVSA